MTRAVLARLGALMALVTIAAIAIGAVPMSIAIALILFASHALACGLGAIIMAVCAVSSRCSADEEVQR